MGVSGKSSHLVRSIDGMELTEKLTTYVLLKIISSEAGSNK
jgi:hypothetical protein